MQILRKKQIMTKVRKNTIEVNLSFEAQLRMCHSQYLLPKVESYSLNQQQQNSSSGTDSRSKSAL